jgi:exopolysaccharide biosynthesis polyprenyl glycosylphosphotransferase
MKKHEFIFSLARIPLDFFGMFVAFSLAKKIREITDGIPGVILPIQTIENDTLLYYSLIWAALYIVIFASHRLYSLNIAHSKIWEYLDILRYGIYWFFFFAVWVYLGNGIIYQAGSEIPRLIILFACLLWMFWSILVRFFLNIVQQMLLKKWYLSKRNLLLISNVDSQKLSNILTDIKLANIYNVLGYINARDIDSPLTYLWSIKEFEELVSMRSCDEILFLDSDFSKTELYEIWEISRIYGIRYRYITNNFDITKTNTSLWLLYKTPVIELNNTPLQNWNRVGKRIFDILLSSSILILLFPLFLIFGVLIRLEDASGPVIYKNRRIGQNGKIFSCYKFRYMFWKYCIKEDYGEKAQNDSALQYEQSLISEKNTRSGPLYKIKNDPRKTKIWAFLEKYSLDEIPQFFNVLKGEMSIVGPRPHQPREVEHYETYQKRLLTIKPWITWMAQVNGRENNDFQTEAELDIFYIENWSFLLDIKIMLKTLSILFSRK